MAFTFFFRDSHSLEKLADFFISHVIGFRKVKIWDAGCAHGPEPYTFAIILAERMSYFAFKNVYIDVTDIDETDTFGKTIMGGAYPESELRRIPKDIFEKYFSKSEKKDHYDISENVRNRMHFTKHDLLKLKPISEGYHLVICKNVLLHFQYKQRIEVIKMFHKSMAPGGFFITEQTQKMPDECKHLFDLKATDANVYQKK